MEMLFSDPSSPEGTTKQLSRKPHHHEQDGEFLKTKKIILLLLSITNLMSNCYQETMPHFFKNIHPHGMVSAAQHR